jgi:hypothetical protein
MHALIGGKSPIGDPVIGQKLPVSD